MSAQIIAPLVGSEHEEGLRAQRLVLPICGTCRSSRWYPEARCSSCGAAGALEWVERQPRGRLLTWTTVHEVALPTLASRTPYTICVVALDGADGARIMGDIVNPAGALLAGAAVVGVFTARDGRPVLDWSLAERGTAP